MFIHLLTTIKGGGGDGDYEGVETTKSVCFLDSGTILDFNNKRWSLTLVMLCASLTVAMYFLVPLMGSVIFLLRQIFTSHRFFLDMTQVK